MFKVIGGIIVFGFATYGFFIWAKNHPSVWKISEETEVKS